ncbi:MAG: XdhC family protein [Magnetospirillum sp.]|nr:XdhC family protein [Magnetospirillum sp.]
MTDANDAAILAALAGWLAEGHAAALATVVSTWGSAPRGIGAHMAVRGDLAFAGSVSGGCIEAAVIAEAGAMLADGRPRRIDVGVGDDAAWAVGLPCGGRIAVGLMAPARETIRTLLDAIGRGEPAALAYAPETGRAAAVTAHGAAGDLALAASDLSRVRELAEQDRSGVLADGLFVRAYGPPWRLVLVGAVHIAQALAPMAAAAGFQVVVVDPRPAFAAPARFPVGEVRCGWPDAVLPDLRLDRRTALVTLAHNSGIDDDALVLALEAGCFHVGALGSRRTHAARRRRLAERGVPEQALDRLSAPVGLDIGARTPAEIAVSVLAEAIAIRRRNMT